MPNEYLRAGRAFEERIARALREDYGFPGAETIRVKHPDRGDIGGILDWTIECKGIAYGHEGARFDLSEASNQAMRARITNWSPYAMVIRQRKNHVTGRALCIVELGIMAPLMRRLEEL